MGEPCIYESKIAEIATDLKNLREGFKDFRENEFHELKGSLTCLIRKMNNPRLPLWTTWLIVGCTSLITALVVLILKGG